MSSSPSELRQKSVVVRAGAGAGKTTELIRRVLNFIQTTQKNEDRDPRLSLTTFTRKATQEIRERLVEAALESGDARLLRYVQQSRSLQISTIHGSLRRYLSQFGSAFGLAPDFSLIDVSQERRLIKRNLRRLLRSNPEVGGQARLVLEEWDLPTFMMAFKEWSANQVRFPEARGLSAQEILAEQDEQLEKIDELALKLQRELGGNGAEKSWIGLLDWLSTELGRKDNSLESWAAASQERPIVRKTKNTSEYVVGLKEELYEALDEIEAWNWTREFAEKSEALRDAFSTTAKALNDQLWQEKIQRGQLTLNDLEVVSLKLIKEFPSTAEKFSATWDFWLIDEYQDTSPLQVEILRALVGRGREFVVGDPQQSIYLFRGARSEVFLEKEKHIAGGGGELLSLKKNYRSSPKLMKFLNRFLTDFSEQLSEMEIAREEDGLWERPAALFWRVPVTLSADAEAKKKASRADEQAAMDLALVERAQELLGLGATPESICVLARKNGDLERLAQLAKRYNLPIHVHTSSQFSERREVRDALSFLRFLVNPHDNVNLVELLRSPWFFTNDAFLAQLGHRGAQSFWSRWLCESSLRDQHSETLTLLKETLEAAEHEGIGVVWQRTLIQRGLIDWSFSVDPSGRREGNLWKLATELRWAERQAGFSYGEFLREAETDAISEEDQGQGEAPTVIEPQKINLMTIHASKGLQFDHVLISDVGADPLIKIRKQAFLADERNGQWALGLRDPKSSVLTCPRWSTLQLEAFKAREQAECDRLLYVALTRAKRSVTLIWSAPHRNSWAERFSARIEDYVDVSEFRAREAQPEAVPSVEQQKTQPRLPWNLILPGFKVPTVSKLNSTLPDLAALEKIQRGIDVHRRMEALKVNWEDPEAQELKTRLEKETEVDLRLLIANGSPEWSFMVRLPEGANREFLQGRLDLWGFDRNNQAWIIDYKTGQIRYADKAIAQLKIYAWALYTLKMVAADQPIRLLPIFISENPGASQEIANLASLEKELPKLLENL